MSIFAIESDKFEIADVICTDTNLAVVLKDGRSLTTPLWWYPRLLSATPQQRCHWEIAGTGRGIHWPEVDEDLSIAGMLRGAKAPGAKEPARVSEPA